MSGMGFKCICPLKERNDDRVLYKFLLFNHRAFNGCLRLLSVRSIHLLRRALVIRNENWFNFLGDAATTCAKSGQGARKFIHS